MLPNFNEKLIATEFLGIPVWVGRKLHTRFKGASKHKRNGAVMGGVAASVSLKASENSLSIGFNDLTLTDYSESLLNLQKTSRLGQFNILRRIASGVPLTDAKLLIIFGASGLLPEA